MTITTRTPKAPTPRGAHLRRGRPRRDEADERRIKRADELMRAAAMVFAEHGPRTTTMDSLSEALGIPKAVLYRYFASKDELLHTMLGRILDQWTELHKRPWRGLSQNLREVIALARANPHELRLLVRNCEADPELRRYYDTLHSTIVRFTEDLLAQASQGMATDPVVRSLSSHAVAGFMLHAVLWWIEHADPARDEDFLRWARESLGTLYRRWMPDADWSQRPQPNDGRTDPNPAQRRPAQHKAAKTASKTPG